MPALTPSEAKIAQKLLTALRNLSPNVAISGRGFTISSNGKKTKLAQPNIIESEDRTI